MEFALLRRRRQPQKAAAAYPKDHISSGGHAKTRLETLNCKMTIRDRHAPPFHIRNRQTAVK